jgi:hypothetical protein
MHSFFFKDEETKPKIVKTWEEAISLCSPPIWPQGEANFYPYLSRLLLLLPFWIYPGLRYPSRFPPMISNAKTEMVKKLTQHFTRATQCGFNFNSISFYSFTSIDSCRQGKRCCCVTSETLQCRSSDRPLENLKYHKVMKRIRKKRSFMMRVLFIEMVDITTPGLSSAVCVFVNFRHRDTAVSAVVPFFL